METLENPRDIFPEELAKYAELLLKSGFDIIYTVQTSQRPRPILGRMTNLDVQTYFFFHRNGHIGYVQYDSLGFSFTTVHKPCTKCGAGFEMGREIKRPNVTMADHVAKTLRPDWARHDEPYVKKYASLAEYLALENVLVKAVIRSEPWKANKATTL